jgi:hypothetical protein
MAWISTPDRIAQKGRRVVAAPRRPARSRSSLPQGTSQSKLRSTTQRPASTPKPFCAGSRSTTQWRMPCRWDHPRQLPAMKAASKVTSRRLVLGLACSEGRGRVTVLYRGGTIRIDRRHLLAPKHPLGRTIVLAWATPREELDHLCVDDAQPYTARSAFHTPALCRVGFYHCNSSEQDPD